MNEPIFEHLEQESARAWPGFTDWFHNDRYYVRKPVSGVLEGTIMSAIPGFVTKIEDAARKWLDSASEEYNRAKAILEEDLPAVAAEARSLASNPVLVSLSNADHLAEVPEALQAIAAFIDSMEARLAAAEPAPAEAPAVPAEAPAA